MIEPGDIEAARAMVPVILRALDPTPLVAESLRELALPADARFLAIGKAWRPMAVGVCARGRAAGEHHRPMRLAVGAIGDAPLEGWEFHGAEHPVPGERSLAASRQVLDWLEGLSASETLVLLLSGGSSAMLCLPRPGVRREELASMTEALLRSGAPIEELNAVRKHCEVLKGGGLAARCGAGRIVTIVLSDVLGDRLDVIGSGPTAPDPTTFEDALAVLDRRGLRDAVPAITALLQEGAAGRRIETVKPNDPLWERTEIRVIGGHLLALDAACDAAAAAGYRVVDRRSLVQGEAAEVGRELARAAAALRASGVLGAAIVWAGETTVTVHGATGVGGRNQELALAAAEELDGIGGVAVMSMATDGRDGPTDAAGAVVDGATAGRLRRAGVNVRTALSRHDSGPALASVGALLQTGPTGTNLNDLMLALVRSR